MGENALAHTPLFHGIRADEIEQLLPCLGARWRDFSKGELILRAGDVTDELGIIVRGSANIVVNSYWGDSVIFGHIGPGEVFAESYAAIPGEELGVDVVAAEECQVCFLDMGKLLTTCERSCPFHHRLIHNMIQLSARKNLGLSRRMTHIAPKSIRKRLLSYLSQQALEQGSSHVTIPFSRQQLADYLGVDRSALSNELSKMRRDGLIDFRKSEFELHPRGSQPAVV